MRVVQADRELLQTLRKTARETLGPNASKDAVERLAAETYEGPAVAGTQPETPAERARREGRTRRAINEMDHWGKGTY